jgi:2'-5' RNA ligase
VRLRAFVAVEIPEGPRQAVADLMRRLRPQADPGLRWVREEALHLTLRFLGWTDPATVDGLRAPLAAAAAACPKFAMRLRGLGTFPEGGRPRVLWVGLEVPKEALVLQEACERIAVEAGFAPELRPFRPHLTLGRWKDRGSRPALPPADLGEGTVFRLVLFRSDLHPAGAVYTPIETFPLG